MIPKLYSLLFLFFFFSIWLYPYTYMLKNLFLGGILGNFIFLFVLFCTFHIFDNNILLLQSLGNFNFLTRWDHRNKNEWQNSHMTLRYLLPLKLNETIGPLFTYPLMPKDNYLNEDLELVKSNKYSSLYTITIVNYINCPFSILW